MVTSHVRPRACTRRTMTFIAVVAVLVSMSFASIAAAHVSRVEVKTVSLINAVRAHYGLRPVHISSHMSVGADRHSIFMARTRSAGHGAWATRVSRYAHSRTIGEIIAWISGRRGQA